MEPRQSQHRPGAAVPGGPGYQAPGGGVNLHAKVPGWITWSLRLVGWSVGLVLIFVAFMFYANIKMVPHLEKCLRQARGPGTPLQQSQAMAACLEREAGWAEKAVLYFQAKPLLDLPAVPCRYVGEWKMSRAPNLVYHVTLAGDRTFVARPIVPPDAAHVNGNWVARGNRIAWFYENMDLWPPDSNPVVEVTETGFTMIERNGEKTRYEMIKLEPYPGCNPQ